MWFLTMFAILRNQIAISHWLKIKIKNCRIDYGSMIIGKVYHHPIKNLFVESGKKYRL